MRKHLVTAFTLIALSCSGGRGNDSAPAAGSTRYEDLASLFTDWREFQKPKLVDDVPDYSASAMAAQYRDLASWQQRLARIDATKWPIAQQVDYHIVRAEMNGLEFDHRVLRPWARDPAFYVSIFMSQSDVPAREGPVARGAIEVWQYQFPLSAEAADDLLARLQVIPKALDLARTNLTENARDLWIAGIGALRDQSRDLALLGTRVTGNTQLESVVQSASVATDSFVNWLDEQAPSRTGPSGIGVDNYNWYLKNVHLIPYSWSDLVTIMHRELARSHSALALEEHRNRRLLPQTMIASTEDYTRRFNAAVTEYMQFLKDREIVSVRDYMDGALRERIGRYTPPGDRPREFFAQIDYRDPLVMRTHGYHWFDLARMRHEPHASPIRSVPLLYNIFDGRAEGHATGMEELMLHAGLFDARPRARELVWILLAQRAARALGDLMMHANASTMDEAIAFTSRWTPRGWLPIDGNTVRGEQHLYLQQPFYGSSYVVGKIEIEKLMGERARQLGAEFSLKRFLDEFNGAGMIPVSLIRLQLTGETDEISRLTEGGASR